MRKTKDLEHTWINYFIKNEHASGWELYYNHYSGKMLLTPYWNLRLWKY